MGDAIFFGVLRMPPELWRDDELDKRQRHARYVQAADEIEALRAECERLRADAERYRWLREALESDDINALSAITSQLAPESADGFDAAIDAAMEASNAG